MQVQKLTFVEYLKNYREYRDAIGERQSKVVLVASGAVTAYCCLAPFLLSALGLRSIHDVHMEFGGSGVFSILAFLISLFLCYSPTAKKERFAKLQGALVEIPSWLMIFGGFALSLQAMYFAYILEGTVSTMVYLITSLIITAVICVHPIIFSVIYVAFSVFYVWAIYYVSGIPSSSGSVYNLVFFLLLVLVLVNIRSASGMVSYLQAKQIDKMREESERFMANVTHEMRTPLNAVLGKNELIRRETKDPDTKKLSEEIASSGKMLLSLINDILDLSKVKAGRMNIVMGEYNTKITQEEIAGIMKSEAEGRGLTFSCDLDSRIPKYLLGDEVRIRQVVLNLLSNAIKYTKEGNVTLKVRVLERPENAAEDSCFLEISVIDTGIGIKEEDIPRLTQDFVRLEEKRNKNTIGTGLGLSITSHLLKLMNSELRVESEYGKGSRFYFILEQKIVESNAQSEKPNTEDVQLSFPDAKVLIVDDNRINYTVAKGLLRYYQIVPTYADSGAKCLELLKEHHYDLIFLDHLMPEMSGIEVMERIRKDYPYVALNTPIIAMTANDSSDAAELYRSHGFASFLAKPIVVSRLNHILEKYLK